HEEKALSRFDLRQPLPARLEANRLDSLFVLYSGLHELGYPDRAWVKSREMLEVGQRSSAPSILAQAYCYAAFHNLIGGTPTVAQRRAEEAMALTEKLGLATLSALATHCYGAALLAQGRYETGIRGMRRGFSPWTGAGRSL